MARDNHFASIDIGTTKVCTIVGNVGEAGDVQILGVGVSPSRGLRKGIVVNIDETTESIRESVNKAEQSSGTKIISAYVGISGGHISSINNRGVVSIARTDRLISDEDIVRVLEAARSINIPSNREIIHVIPRSYVIDGQEGVKNPIGMHGFRLDAETHIITGAITSIQNLVKCVNNAGIEVDDLVLQPLASSEAVITDEEREIGVVLADIGGGTTDVAIFIDGSIWHTAVLPVGGYHLTNDIAIGLRTPFATAEEIKAKYGHAIPDTVSSSENIQIVCFGSEGTRAVPRKSLSEIIRARTEEVLEMILLEIKRSGLDAMIPAGLVMTGGTSNLQGIEVLASEVLQLPVRVGKPRGLHGLVDTVNNPAYATSVGLLLWGLKHGGMQRRTRKNGHSIGSFLKRFVFWMRELIPQ